MSEICGRCGAQIETPRYTRRNISTGEVQWICVECMPPPPRLGERLRRVEAKLLVYGLPLALLAAIIFGARACFS